MDLIKKYSYNIIAQYILILTVSLTILKPAVHYVGYALILLLLIYGKIKYNDPVLVFGENKSRCITIMLILFFLWSAFINVFQIPDLMLWGKGASVYLELVIGYFFSMRLLNSEKSRKDFISIFVLLTTILFCLIIIKELIPEIGAYLPRRFKMNRNVLGLYPVLAMPYIFFYSLWLKDIKPIYKYAACLASLFVLVLSFSSGAWLAGASMLPLILYFAFRYRKLSVIELLCCTVLCLSALTASRYLAPDSTFTKLLLSEYEQITAVSDIDKLTTHRYTIWRATLYLIMEKPFVGFGSEYLDHEYKRILREHASDFKAEGMLDGYDHTHNMYLQLAFSSGIPSVLLFLAVLALMMQKSWRNRFYIENGVPWYLIFFVMLFGQIFYGLTGDVFQERRMLAVIFWCSLGLIAVLPECDNRENH